MALYIPTATWQEKPPAGTPIDWAHPLAQGLVAAWALNERAGNTVINLIDNGLGELTGSTWDPSGLSFNGSTDYVDTNYRRGYTDLTYYARCRGDSAPTTNAPTGVIGDNFAALTWHHTSAAYQEGLVIKVGAPWHVVKFDSLSADIWYDLACTYDGETMHAYTDGILSNSNTGPSGVISSATVDLHLAKHALAGQYWDGDIDVALVYNRALTAVEVADLSANPWQIFESPSMVVPAISLPVGISSMLVNGGLVNTGLINTGLIR